MSHTRSVVGANLTALLRRTPRAIRGLLSGALRPSMVRKVRRMPVTFLETLQTAATMQGKCRPVSACRSAAWYRMVKGMEMVIPRLRR